MKTRSLKVFFTPRLAQRNFCGEIKNVVLHYVFYLRKCKPSNGTEFAPGVLVLIIIKFNDSMLTIMTKQKQ